MLEKLLRFGFGQAHAQGAAPQAQRKSEEFCETGSNR